jgi:hypothetical protein
MPKEMLEKLPGYAPDIAVNRAEAREIMEKLGYGPDKRLKIKLSTRDIPAYRDPAVILLDQLKEVYIDAELEPVDCDGPGCLDSFRGRHKLKAGSRLMVSPFPEIELIASCCGVL